MLEAAEAILGSPPEIDLLSNQDLSREDLEAEAASWLNDHPGNALLLTDIGFGSCGQAALSATRGRDDVGVVAGVNLPLLLTLLQCREFETFENLMGHLAERGRGCLQFFLRGGPI
jgi:mannose/fructose-specific phosphotransferase system component IIA